MRKSIAVVFVVLLCRGEVAKGAPIVVPNALAATEGNFDLTTSVPFRFQQVYAASEFPGPMTITGMVFRPDGTFGSAFTSTFADYNVQLSTTSKAPDGLSATYADNIGPDVTTVLTGATALSSSYVGPVGGPKAFDVVVNFTTPFFYDPADGNLLFDQESFSGASTSFVLDYENVGGDSISTVFGSAGDPTAFYVDTLGLVTQFIPEPSTIVLAAMGLAALAACGWRRKR